MRYQYNLGTGATTISYEARNLDGTDSSAGTYDVVVNLTGADSLAPDGSFGLMPMNYHSTGQLNPADFDIVEYKATCVVRLVDADR